jgi:hypothetical protein
MKLFKNRLLMATLAAFLAVNFMACQRDKLPAPPKESPQAAKIKRLFKNMPKLVITDPKTGKQLRIADGGFSFANPPSTNFSDPNTGVVWTNSETGGTLYVTGNAFGNNSGGGSVGAGSYTYPINYAFCFQADNDFWGTDLFEGWGRNFDGVSGVIGISGDLSPENLEGGEDIEDILNGFAYYLVYDSRAQGNYRIINWFDELEDPDDLEGQGFAMIIDFKNEKLFFSKSGQLNVSGGNMTFTGTYLQIDASMFEDDDDPTFREVSGFGTMGCE